MIEVVNHKECCGCGACAQVCPKECIELVANETGFKYPKIDINRCTDCKLCIKTCPIATKKENNNDIVPLCYAGVHRIEDVLMNSSSGGAFTAIVEAFHNNNNNYKIFGAAYDDNLIVEHRFVDNISDITIFRKSKYVQSDTKNTFRQVKEFLEQGEMVMYTGTPCQIAGLKSFLKFDYENLLCIDLICTGIASPLFFGKNIQFLENRENKKILNCDMRNKIKRDNSWIVMNTKIEFDDQTILSDKYSNMYKACYGQRLGFRECCYSCNYAKLPRVSDITIADWWGGAKTLPDMEEDRGISLIMFNNPKWYELFEEINSRMNLIKVDIDEAIKQNPTLSKPNSKKNRNDKFWVDFKRRPVEKVLKKYSKPPVKIRIVILTSKLFPKYLRRRVKKLIFKYRII
ncbi:Coenzyme F420 hydrogenase/dehydrogenase, beta subunit C-terminal domain [Clostridium sp. DL1XJH146]